MDEIINIYNNCILSNISIIKYENNKNNKYNIKYNNKSFVIDPNISFSNCKLCKNNNIYSIKINIDLLNTSHINFKNFINKLSNRLNICVGKEDNLIIDEICNPINNNKDLIPNTKLFYTTINNDCKIINIETDEDIELSILQNKLFNMYPIFYPPTLNIWNNKVYINFTVYKIYVKFVSEINKELNYEPNKQFILDLMNNT